MRKTPWPDLRRPLALTPLRGKAPQATQGVFHFRGYQSTASITTRVPRFISSTSPATRT